MELADSIKYILRAFPAFLRSASICKNKTKKQKNKKQGKKRLKKNKKNKTAVKFLHPSTIYVWNTSRQVLILWQKSKLIYSRGKDDMKFHFSALARKNNFIYLL